MTASPRLGTRGRPEESRAAILKAAVAEFAEFGIAARGRMRSRGRRMSTRRCFITTSRTRTRSTKRFSTMCSAAAGAGDAGARKRTASAAEDAGICGGVFRLHRGQSAVSAGGAREWMRSGAGPSRMQRVAREYFRPIFEKVAGVLREGIEAGEFRAVDPMDFLPSVVADNSVLFQRGAADEDAG
jgi:hypothetical protein